MSNSPFTLYPAIDLRDGRVVRLQQGDLGRQTVYDDDPLAVARKWIDQGATWLHIVNLDGAFSGDGQKNLRCLPGLIALGAHIQFGGGLRTLEDISAALEMGVSRIVVGTTAVSKPAIVGEAIGRFGPHRLAVGIDAFEGRVRTHGWRQTAAVSPAELGRHMKALGLRTIIHTDIGRDGLLTGANVAASATLAGETGLSVIVSGGMATLDDVRLAWQGRDRGIQGVIIGRALYEGQIQLGQALEVSNAR